MGDIDSRESELGMDGLSLIDVSSEDDSLLFSWFMDPADREFSEADMDDKVLGFLGNTHSHGEEIHVSSLEEKEKVLQPHESPEPEKMTKRGKYNLRKSLAWDNAFFTSDGFLEPEELSSMMESNHIMEKQTLPAIQEDLHRSTESISTLQSDCTAGDGHDFNLFEDIRASIQRSTGASDAAITDKKELGGTGVAITSTPNMVDPVSQNKTKPKAGPKKPSIRAQGLGNTTKQPVSAKAVSTSIYKPPKGLSGVRPMSTASMKRTSLDVNKTKQEKDSKFIPGKGSFSLKTTISGSGRTIPLRPAVPAKTSLRSSVASKNELTSSCSSLESSASASSSASQKSSLSSIKKKNDPSSTSANHSLVNRTITRAAPRSITQSRNPPLSTYMMSKAKLSSSGSPASSVSDLSSESSRASTPGKMARGNQKNVPGERGSTNDNTPQTLKPRNNCSNESSVAPNSKVDEPVLERVKRFSVGNGGVVHPPLGKSTGLRMPSPKIGFFDGVRSVARTPTRNIQPRPGVLNGLTSSKPGKLQPARPPLQESSNPKTKVIGALSSVTIVSPSSMKAQSRVSTRTGAEKHLKDEVDSEVKSTGKITASPASGKDKGSRRRQSPALVKSNGKLNSSVDRSSASGCENIIPSMKVADEGEMMDKTLYNQIDKPTEPIGDVDSDKRTELENDFAGASFPHVSEVKTAGEAEALDNTSSPQLFQL